MIHLGDFHCIVEAERLVAQPITSYESLDEAQKALEPHLRAWELRSELEGTGRIRFKKTGHEVRDERGGQVIGVGIVEEVGITNEVIPILTTSRLAVPEGPPLLITEEVERIRARWRDVVEGRERLLVGAYWMLTELERYYGGRSAAATALRISGKVLGRLGLLSSWNDPEHGRKAKSSTQPLAPDEIDWIRSSLPLLILRVAEVESGLTNTPEIKMADLPVLRD